MPKRHQALSLVTAKRFRVAGSLPFITAGELIDSVFICLAASALLDFRDATRLSVTNTAIRRCLRSSRIDLSTKALKTDSLQQMLQFWKVVGVNVKDCAQMLRGCIHLRTAILRGRLVDVSALGQCSSLQTVDLSECSQLTDVSGLPANLTVLT